MDALCGDLLGELGYETGGSAGPNAFVRSLA
jgi:hypothetical protein